MKKMRKLISILITASILLANVGLNSVYAADCAHENKNSSTEWNVGLCTNGGISRWNCLDCGEVGYKTLTAYPTHSFSGSVCTRCGYTQDDCTHDNATHGTITWNNSNCMEGGTRTWSCSDCTASGTEYVMPNESHTLDTNGNCTVAGCNYVCPHKFTTLANKCDDCGKITPHTCVYAGDVADSDVTWTSGDCTKGGSATKPCDLCGEDTVLTVIAKDAHTHAADVNDADVTWTDNDCTKGGNVNVTCDVCGKSYGLVVEAKEGHSYIEETNKIGTVEYNCLACNKAFTVDYPDNGTCDHAGQYELKDVNWDGNCTTGGKITFTCSKCNKVINAVVDPQSFHTFATDGSGKCKLCDTPCSHSGEVIPYYEFVSNGTHARKFECAVCHKKDVTPVGTIEPDTKTANCSDYAECTKIDAKKHSSVCSVCKHQISASENHAFDADGKCTKCDYQCPHANIECVHKPTTDTHKIACKDCGKVIENGETCTRKCISIDKKNHKIICTKCNEVYTSTEAHSFGTEGKCSKCEYACPHEKADLKYTSNPDNTHDTKCQNCNKKIETKKACTYDKDKICTICGGMFICQHDGEMTYKFTSANHHNKVCVKCDEIITPDVPCTFNKYPNKCDDCGHVTEHSHTYDSNYVCTKCGATCKHDTTAYKSLGDNKHAVVCAACEKVVKLSEDCTFLGGTLCTKCETQHTHKYTYEEVSSSQHKLKCTICNASSTESHRIYYEYKGKDDDEYEHYKKCRDCGYEKIESCTFKGTNRRCEYCDHKKDKEEKKDENGNVISNGGSSGTGTGANDYIHGLINGGKTNEAIEKMKAEPKKYLDELRKSGIALQKGTVLGITGNEYNELCAVESSERDTNNQLMYANYFGTQLGYTKFSPTKTYTVYPLWTYNVKDLPMIVSWANTGCQFGDTVYVVWYSYEAHDMRLIPALVDQNGVVSVAIPKITSCSVMTVVKCEKEDTKASKKSTEKKDSKTTEETVETEETTEIEESETLTETTDKSADEPTNKNQSKSSSSSKTSSEVTNKPKSNTSSSTSKSTVSNAKSSATNAKSTATAPSDDTKKTTVKTESITETKTTNSKQLN